MGGVPARFNDFSDGRVDGLNAKLEDLEERLRTAQLEEERLRVAEKNLLDGSERRIHDFERRLEHEWLALRQLHEEPLRAINQHTTTIAENCADVVREALVLLRSRNFEPESHAAPALELVRERPKRQYSKALIWILLGAVAALSVMAYRFGAALHDMEARTTAAEERTRQLQAFVVKQIQESEQSVQRYSADALATAARAERLANVLAAPDVRTYPLRSQRPSAAAEGQVFFSPSRGVALTASQLPPTSKDQVYQVWMTTTQGPISLGFAVPDALGRASSALDAPPELFGVIGFMLTAEPLGGSVKPAGAIVLAS